MSLTERACVSPGEVVREDVYMEENAGCATGGVAR